MEWWTSYRWNGGEDNTIMELWRGTMWNSEGSTGMEWCRGTLQHVIVAGIQAWNGREVQVWNGGGVQM